MGLKLEARADIILHLARPLPCPVSLTLRLWEHTLKLTQAS